MRRAQAFLLLALTTACSAGASQPKPARAGVDVWQYTKDSGAVIRAAEVTLRSCYEANSSAEGTVPSFAIEWLVDETGSVSWVSLLGGAFDSTAIESCLIERASSMSFPARAQRGAYRLRQRFPITDAPPQVSLVSRL